MKTHRPQRPSRRLGILVGAVSAALALTACSGGGSEASGDGTLTIGAATNLQTLDPQMAAVAQEYYVNPVFDTLIHAQPDGTFEPGLAEEWEIVDPVTFELTVRPDVVFSDGEPMDTDAVVANFERGMGMEASPSAAFYSNIAGVEAVDDSTVRLTLSEPTTDMLSQLSRLPGMMMSPASFEANPETTPIGAGGWTYDAAASNAGEVQVYRANPDYWDTDRVGVDTVEIRALEDASAATNAVLDGQVDVIEMRSEADRSTLDNGSLQLIERANANVYYVQIMDTDGTLIEPMGDERVRRALNLAIDRESVMKGLQFGQGDPSPSFWLEETPYYDEDLEDLAYDPEEARDLLAEAGYADGFSVTFPSFGAITEVAESVQQMWGEIGVEVTIDQVEPGTLADVMRNGTTAMAVTLARGFTAESHYDERHAPGSPYDPLGTDRGDVAELADIALNAETEEGQAEGWRDVYSYLIEQGYLMVVAHQIPVVVAAEHVSGAELSPSDNLPKPYDITLD
ncbi:ABC transporter substrate-binding protein [Aeromicrobium piscarium]|nr:ABC transporter substrate-binding protein [Aeromicrobium piscarium]